MHQWSAMIINDHQSMNGSGPSPRIWLTATGGRRAGLPPAVGLEMVRADPWPKGTTFLAWDFIVFWIEGFALFVIGVGHFQTFVKGQSWRRTFLGRQHSWWLLYNVKVLLRLSLPFGQQRAPFKAVSFLGLVVPWSRQFQPILDSFGRGEISVACQCTADQTAVKWVATSLVFSTQKATWSLERWLKDERS